ARVRPVQPGRRRARRCRKRAGAGDRLLDRACAPRSRARGQPAGRRRRRLDLASASRGGTMIRRLAISALAAALIGALASGCGSGKGNGSSSTSASASPSAATLAPIHGTYTPSIDPANFVAVVDNPYWPLVPGTRFHFEGVRGTAAQTDDAVVKHETKKILGITCTVVQDTVSQGGRPIERTYDWYAQDKQGNVWYMGEDSFELKNGRFAKASDSWQSGVDGAKPGIIMPANPQPGDTYRQA